MPFNPDVPLVVLSISGTTIIFTIIFTIIIVLVILIIGESYYRLLRANRDPTRLLVESTYEQQRQHGVTLFGAVFDQTYPDVTLEEEMKYRPSAVLSARLKDEIEQVLRNADPL